MKSPAILSLLVALAASSVAPAGMAQGASTAAILLSRSYSASDGSTYSALYRVSPSGQNLVPLTSAQPGIDNEPGSWSPSGSSLVYEHFRSTSPAVSQLSVVDRQGSSARRITSGQYKHQQASWGPGGVIAYVADRGNHHFCLAVVHADGQGQRDLFCPNIFDRPTEPMTLSTPKWTPSGKAVVFEAAAYEDNLDESYWISHVYRVNVTTGAVTELTQQQLIEQTALEVAPDATHGIYAFVYAARPMALVDFASGTQTTLGFGRSPRYSHDGGRIAFTQPGQVYVMNADGSNPHPVLANPDPSATYTVADWSWDGTRLLVTKTAAKSVLQTVDLATGNASYVTGGAAADRGWFHD